MPEPTAATNIPPGWFRPEPVDAASLARDIASARRRAFLTVALLAGQLAISAFEFALWLQTQRMLGGPGLADIAGLFGIDQQALALVVLSLTTYVVTGIFFIGWMRKVVSVAKVASPVHMTYGQGMATFAFLIPFANLVLPYLVLRQATAALGGAARARRIVLAWWLAWIVFSIFGQILLISYSAYDAMVALAQIVGWVVSALLAIATVATVQGLVARTTVPLTDAVTAPEPTVMGVRGRIGWFRGAVLSGVLLLSVASIPAMLAATSGPTVDATGWVREDLPEHGISLAHPAWFRTIEAEGEVEGEDGFTALWMSGDSRPGGGSGVLAVGYLAAGGATLEDLRFGFESAGGEVADATLEGLPALHIKIDNDALHDAMDHAYATVWRNRIYMVVLTAPSDRIEEYAADLERVARSFRYRAPDNRT